MSESVHLLGSGGSPIGVLSKPSAETPISEVAVIFLNSGLLHRVGPFGLYVTLARRLAENGFCSLRIDQSGKGDSERRSKLTFEESMERDFEDAASFMRRSVGAKRFVVIGLCSGADDSLHLAAKFDDVCGAVLLEAFAFRTPRYYLRHYAPRLLRLDLYLLSLRRAISWLRRRLVSILRPGADRVDSGDLGVIREFSGPAEIRERYRIAIGRGVKLLCVFTDGSRSYYNYEGQLLEALQSSGSDEFVKERYFPGVKHTYPLACDREAAMDVVVGWVRSEFSMRETGDANVDTADWSVQAKVS